MAEKDAALQEIEGLSDLPPSIDVDLGGEAPDAGDKTRKAQAGDPPQPKEDENVIALRRQLNEQKRAREAAEARARDLEDQRQRAEAQTAEGQLRLINNSLEAAETAKTRAKSDLKAAMSTGDHDAAVEAQEALNEAQIKRDQLMRGKTSMEERAERERADRERKPAERSFNDPVEAMVSTVSAKSGAWLREHPECVTDTRKNRQMIRAHEDAVDDGVDVDSPEYFAFIEKRLGFGNSDVRQEQQQRQEPAPRRPAPTDAPPSRATSNDGRGSRQNTVTLTPTQRQFCDESGIKYEDYARSMVELKKEGRLQ